MLGSCTDQDVVRRYRQSEACRPQGACLTVPGKALRRLIPAEHIDVFTAGQLAHCLFQRRIQVLERGDEAHVQGVGRRKRRTIAAFCRSRRFRPEKGRSKYIYIGNGFAHERTASDNSFCQVALACFCIGTAHSAYGDP